MVNTPPSGNPGEPGPSRVQHDQGPAGPLEPPPRPPLGPPGIEPAQPPPRDPTGDAVPDFTSPDRAQEVDDLMAQHGITDAALAQTLLAGRWFQQHQLELREWHAHQSRLAAEAAQELREGALPSGNTGSSMNAAKVTTGGSTKRKLPRFGAGTPLQDVDSAPMCLYAIQQLSDFKYVPIYSLSLSKERI